MLVSIKRLDKQLSEIENGKKGDKKICLCEERKQ